jgi:propionyl-CoA synthetase
LPKTRSGKVLRGTLKKIIDGEPYKVPATIEDGTILDKIKQRLIEYGKGMGEHANIVFSDSVDKIKESVNDMVDQE